MLHKPQQSHNNIYANNSQFFILMLILTQQQSHNNRVITIFQLTGPLGRPPISILFFPLVGPPIIPLHDNRVIQFFCGLLMVGPPIIKRFVVEDVPSHFNNLVDVLFLYRSWLIS